MISLSASLVITHAKRWLINMKKQKKFLKSLGETGIPVSCAKV